jgi:predicted transcriptional regulator
MASSREEISCSSIKKGKINERWNMLERTNIVRVFSSICMDVVITLYLNLLECNNKIDIGRWESVYPKKKKDLQKCLKFFSLIEQMSKEKK